MKKQEGFRFASLISSIVVSRFASAYLTQKVWDSYNRWK